MVPELDTIIIIQIPRPGKQPNHWDPGHYWHAGMPPFSTPGDLSHHVTDATRQRRQDAEAKALAIAQAQHGIRASTWKLYGAGTMRQPTALYELR